MTTGDIILYTVVLSLSLLSAVAVLWLTLYFRLEAKRLHEKYYSPEYWKFKQAEIVCRQYSRIGQQDEVANEDDPGEYWKQDRRSYLKNWAELRAGQQMVTRQQEELLTTSKNMAKEETKP